MRDSHTYEHIVKGEVVKLKDIEVSGEMTKIIIEPCEEGGRFILEDSEVYPRRRGS
jgi:hypothetical protein